MIRILYLAALVVLFGACGAETHNHGGEEHTDHDHDGHSHEEEEAGDGIHFGLKEIDDQGVVALADLFNQLETGEGLGEIEIGAGEDMTKVSGISTKVEGTVSEVCRSAGCWFTFKTEEGKEMFFSMKEHKGVPKDCVGKTFVVEGQAYKVIKSIEELQAEKKTDGATEEDLAAITEPSTEYKFIAEGVLLKK